MFRILSDLIGYAWYSAFGKRAHDAKVARIKAETRAIRDGSFKGDIVLDDAAPGAADPFIADAAKANFVARDISDKKHIFAKKD